MTPPTNKLSYLLQRLDRESVVGFVIFLRQPTILRAVLLSVRRAASVFISGAALLFRCAAWLFVRRAAVECSFVELLLECSFVELKGRSSAELLECSSVKLLDCAFVEFLTVIPGEL